MLIRRSEKDIKDAKRILPFAIAIMALIVLIVASIMCSIPLLQGKVAGSPIAATATTSARPLVTATYEQAEVTPSPPADIYRAGQIAHIGSIDLAVIGWDFVKDRDTGLISHIVVDAVFRNSGEETTYLFLHDELILRGSQGQESLIDEEHELIDPRGALFTLHSKRLMPGDFARSQFLFPVPGKIGDAFALSYDSIEFDDPPIAIDLGDRPVELQPPAELIAAPANLAPMGKASTSDTAALAVLKWETTACGWKSEPRQCIIVEGLVANTGDKPFEIFPALISITGQDFEKGYLENDPAMNGFGNMEQTIIAPGERTLVRAVFYANRAGEPMLFYLESYFQNDSNVNLPRTYVALSDQPGKADPPDGFPGQVALQPLGLNEEITTGITSWKVTGFHFIDRPSFEKVQPGMRYLVTDLVVKNLNPEGIVDLTRYQICLKDAQGRTYRDYAGLALPEQDLERMSTLEPGAVVTVQLGFEVPEQASALYLAVKEPGKEYSWNFVFVELLASEAAASPATRTPVPSSTPVNDAVLSIQATTIAAASTPQPAVTRPPSSGSRLGEIVQSGYLSMAVLGWNNPDSVGIEFPDIGLVYMQVEVLVANSGEHDLALDYKKQFALVDMTGKRYLPDITPYGLSGELFDQVYFFVGSGERLRMRLLFSIPVGTTGLTLVTDASPQMGSLVEVPLGRTPELWDNPGPLPGEMPVSPSGNARLSVFDVTYRTASFLETYQGIPPLPGRKYLQVSLQVKNISNTSSNLEIFRRAYLKDSLDRPFVAIFGPDLSELGAGKEAMISLVFEVPVDAREFILVVRHNYDHHQDSARTYFWIK